MVVQATRPGPMLRGGTVVLLSGPRSGFFMPRRFPSMLEFEGPDSFDVDTLDRVLQGPSVFGPPLRMCACCTMNHLCHLRLPCL